MIRFSALIFGLLASCNKLDSLFNEGVKADLFCLILCGLVLGKARFSLEDGVFSFSNFKFDGYY